MTTAAERVADSESFRRIADARACSMRFYESKRFPHRSQMCRRHV